MPREESVFPRRVRHRPPPVQSRCGLRLGRAERIRRGADYREVYENAQSWHGRLCVIFLFCDGERDRRAGFVAGRKVGGAVKRNRARRLLRESYRKFKQRLPEKGVQFVFVAKAACPGHALTDVMEEMGDLLTRAGVL